MFLKGCTLGVFMLIVQFATQRGQRFITNVIFHQMLYDCVVDRTSFDKIRVSGSVTFLLH